MSRKIKQELTFQEYNLLNTAIDLALENYADDEDSYQESIEGLEKLSVKLEVMEDEHAEDFGSCARCDKDIHLEYEAFYPLGNKNKEEAEDFDQNDEDEAYCESCADSILNLHLKSTSKLS